MNKRSRYWPWQLLFGVLFILSACFFLIGTVTRLNTGPVVSGATQTAQAPRTETPSHLETPGPSPTPVVVSPPPAIDLSNYFLIVVLPILSAGISLVGFISTTVLAWRKERREAGLATLELQRTTLELEKTRLELEKLKGEQDKPKA